MAVGALEPQFFAALLHGLGLDPEDTPAQWDRGGWPDLRTVLAAAFASRTRDEWAEVFAGTDGCVTPVLTFDEALAHPHLAYRRTFTRVAGVDQPSPAPRFSRTVPASPPEPVDNQDLAQALCRWATLSRPTSGGAIARRPL